jgi:hypothetical protein
MQPNKWAKVMNRHEQTFQTRGHKDGKTTTHEKMFNVISD